MKTRVGINGFGRIGRNALKAILEKYEDRLEVVAVNDLTDTKTLAHLLKYDSVYGKFEGTVEAGLDSLIVNGKQIKVVSERDPAKIDWKSLNVELVLESTGLFTKREKAEVHITGGGAKKVLISAPASGEDITLVMGVNHIMYNPEKHNIVSNASCTTNCLAPLVKVLNDSFGIEKGMMVTVHSYTNDQRILDLPHNDLRRARAAGMSIIPTKTGAAKAIGLVVPEVDGKLNGFSYRVPTGAVSIVDLTVEIGREVSKDEVNNALKAAADGYLKGIMEYSEEPLVSVDYKQNSASSVVDSLLTMVTGGNMVKVAAWYDNEWGYANRCADVLAFMAERG